MKKFDTNYAFIDAQNLHLGIRSLGWDIDYKKLRVYLTEKYSVKVAYLFVGYIPQNRPLYSSLQKAGYILIFKPVIEDADGRVKGNVDADLVLQAMIDFDQYNRAVIISSDGDFYSLVKYLYNHNKLQAVLSPYIRTCSILLRQSAKEKIVFMDNLKNKLVYKRKSTA